MRILKITGIVILLIIAVLLLAAVFIPKSYTVSVSVNINQPRQVVYDYVRILENQKEYSIWVMADPDLKPEYIGTDGTVGAIQKWDSQIDDVGAGEQEITSLSPDRMDVDLRFIRPFKGIAKAASLFTALTDSTSKLTSEFYSNDSYPLNLPSYIFGRKMMKEAQTANLENIKRILEGRK
jgi:hypothetical protein